MSKSKDIQFLANQLKVNDSLIEISEKINELPFTEISVHGSSDSKGFVMTIPDSLKEHLVDLLCNHFYEERHKIFEQIMDILNNNHETRH